MNAWTDTLMPHLLLAPVLTPLLTAAVMLLLPERAIAIRGWLGMVSCLFGLAAAALLVIWTRNHDASIAVGVYLPGNWRVPFGIALAVDQPAIDETLDGLVRIG